MTTKIKSERPIILGGPELKRRLALRRIGALAGLTAFGGTSALLGGCGGGGNGDSAVPPLPSLGAHALAWGSAGVAAHPTTVALDTLTSSGSTILVCVGRGDIDLHVEPTDNMANTYALLEGVHNYGQEWPFAGTALYSSSASGGVNEISASNPNRDEITVAVVEILNGGVIEDLSWRYANVPGPFQTSDPVTTTGPATLVAFWWGAANAHDQTAVPRDDFTPLDSVLEDPRGQWVQCAVAFKNVSAGVHTVTWDATPDQGAQLYLVAVQNA